MVSLPASNSLSKTDSTRVLHQSAAGNFAFSLISGVFQKSFYDLVVF